MLVDKNTVDRIRKELKDANASLGGAGPEILMKFYAQLLKLAYDLDLLAGYAEVMSDQEAAEIDQNLNTLHTRLESQMDPETTPGEVIESIAPVLGTLANVKATLGFYRSR